jgi:hypothetical protein
LKTTTNVPTIMKNQIVMLSCVVAALATFTVWNGTASGQSNSGAEGRVSSDPPLNLKYIITLDARSNSRSTMPEEMQVLSGFVRQDTVRGTLIQSNAQWLVLKDGDAENWVPRDKALMVRLQR